VAEYSLLTIFTEAFSEKIKDLKDLLELGRENRSYTIGIFGTTDARKDRILVLDDSSLL
jgi:hypothetical protein